MLRNINVCIYDYWLNGKRRLISKPPLGVNLLFKIVVLFARVAAKGDCNLFSWVNR